jgi:hypothetical protein
MKSWSGLRVIMNKEAVSRVLANEVFMDCMCGFFAGTHRLILLLRSP